MIEENKHAIRVVSRSIFAFLFRQEGASERMKRSERKPEVTKKEKGAKRRGGIKYIEETSLEY